jgi:uncharacterized protein YjbJ (UPF0337 family)
MADDVKERGKAAGEQVKGKVQQAWGDLTGDEESKAEGMANESKGKLRDTKEDVKDVVEDVKDAFTGDRPRR